MLPTYMAIENAVSLIREKMGEHITSDWLLQHAHEGKIQLFALVREPICYLEQVELAIDRPDQIIAQVLRKSAKGYISPSGGTKSPPNNATALKIGGESTNIDSRVQKIGDAIFRRLEQLSDHEPECAAYPGANSSTSALSAIEKTDLQEKTLVTTNVSRECLSIADYFQLEPVWAGGIFASRDIPRATDIDKISIKGERRTVFTCSMKRWRVAESDLFLNKSKLHAFLDATEVKNIQPVAEVVGKRELLVSRIRRMRENPDGPTFLTKQQMMAKLWPLHGLNLKRIFSDPPNWAKDACVYRTGRGNGSSLWSPAVFGFFAATTSSSKRPKVNKKVMDAFIKQHFPEWTNAWEELADYI